MSGGFVDLFFRGDADVRGVATNIETSKAPQTSKLMKRPNCARKSKWDSWGTPCERKGLLKRAHYTLVFIGVK